MKKKEEYRIQRFYVPFFAHDGFRLQRKVRFWKWSWWETIEEDNLGIHGNKWAEHFQCAILTPPHGEKKG